MGRGDRALFLPYLSNAIFDSFFFFFSISAIFRGKKGGQSWNKNVSFGYFLFPWKFHFFKYSLNKFFFILKYYLELFSKIGPYLGEQGPKKKKKKQRTKRAISWILNWYEKLKIYNFTTSNVIQRNFPRLCIFKRSLIWLINWCINRRA